MITQADYTPEEWDLILGAPALTALVIVHAEQCSPGVAYLKVSATVTAIAESGAMASRSELIQAVTDAVRVGQSPLWPTQHPRDLADVGGWALDACRRVAALLAQRAPEDEADAFSHWLLSIGQRVALAPATGSLLGLSSEAIGEPHRLALEALAAALDVSQPGVQNVP